MKLLQIGDQWVRSDIVVYIRAESDTLRIDCLNRETVLVNYATTTEAKAAATAFAAAVNAEIA